MLGVAGLAMLEALPLALVDVILALDAVAAGAAVADDIVEAALEALAPVATIVPFSATPVFPFSLLAPALALADVVLALDAVVAGASVEGPPEEQPVDNADALGAGLACAAALVVFSFFLGGMASELREHYRVLRTGELVSQYEVEGTLSIERAQKKDRPDTWKLLWRAWFLGVMGAGTICYPLPGAVGSCAQPDLRRQRLWSLMRLALRFTSPL